MFSKKYPDWAYLLIRVALGIVFIVHGYMKLFGGILGTTGFFSSLGIPTAGFFAIVVAIVEFFGGIAVLLGIFTRIASALIFIDMLVAFILVHGKNGFLVSNNGFEFVFVLGLMAVSLIFSGAGKISLDKMIFKKN
ncbi:MAG: DoxX family protein [Nanoarchaeota archaeon]